jgi:hypothetical protein
VQLARQLLLGPTAAWKRLARRRAVGHCHEIAEGIRRRWATAQLHHPEQAAKISQAVKSIATALNKSGRRVRRHGEFYGRHPSYHERPPAVSTGGASGWYAELTGQQERASNAARSSLNSSFKIAHRSSLIATL